MQHNDLLNHHIRRSSRQQSPSTLEQRHRLRHPTFATTPKTERHPKIPNSFQVVKEIQVLQATQGDDRVMIRHATTSMTRQQQSRSRVSRRRRMGGFKISCKLDARSKQVYGMRHSATSTSLAIHGAVFKNNPQETNCK
ncbi:hypothetical protein OH76DRAFT_721868 [Lentinus brumalis]|uniref:Uncharacterized protein n=1 Tax=Lentinus brumalis TaxID=2498619 RepID=A0A371D4Z4_9APHY|nr:hypothetical protein OH76DRAFT_721868 [Polyporus brumalis]